MLIRSQGDRGERSLYYDGETLSYNIPWKTINLQPWLFPPPSST
ncbi:MAG: hypothetical protein WDM78_16660 [Puia sp.]